MTPARVLLCGRAHIEAQLDRCVIHMHVCRQPYRHLGAHLCWQCDFTWADDDGQ